MKYPLPDSWSLHPELPLLIYSILLPTQFTSGIAEVHHTALTRFHKIILSAPASLILSKILSMINRNGAALFYVQSSQMLSTTNLLETSGKMIMYGDLELKC